MPGPEAYPRSADALETLVEPAGVALLGAGEGLEPFGYLGEALVARRTGEAGVHLGVLVGLALGDGPEQGRDVRVTLDVGLLGEVEVAAVRLALAGEGFLQVGVRPTALELGHG